MTAVKKAGLFLCIVLFSINLSLFAAPLSASAADADSVWVNNVELTSSAPYWVNGSATALTSEPVGGWNAYFDAANATLTLDGAVLDTLYAYSAYYGMLLFADGDLRVVLKGTSTLQYNASGSGTFTGLYVQGYLRISGDGTATIQMNTTSSSVSLYGIYGYGIDIESGSIQIVHSSSHTVYGIIAYDSIQISGGTVSITCNARYGVGIFVEQNDFTMTGGNVTAEIIGSSTAEGLYAKNILLEGGEGRFLGSLSGSATGGYLGITNNTLRVSGGHFVFSGPYVALFAATAAFTVDLSGVVTEVSEYASGSGKRLWSSPADGVLVHSTAASSPFSYVEFTEIPASVRYPRTGDGARPWFWAGAALLGLLGAAGFLLGTRRKGFR